MAELEVNITPDAWRQCDTRYKGPNELVMLVNRGVAERLSNCAYDIEQAYRTIS